MITIFKTGEIDYPDVKGIDKPVKYTIDNLIEVASRTSNVKVTNEHTKDVIGELSNFIVKDGLLMADEPNNLELKDKGFSPVFNYDLIDMGGYYVPKNIVMTEIGLTSKPRSRIVYNSIDTIDNGDSSMDDKQLRQALDDNKKLQEEIGVLKSQNKQLNKYLKEKESEIKKIKESYKDVDEKLDNYDSLKEIEEKYNSLMSSKKDDLIYKIAGDDSSIVEKIKDYSIEQLETTADLLKGDEGGRGITPQTNPVDDGDEPPVTNDDTPNGDEAIEFYENAFGEKPSFLTE